MKTKPKNEVKPKIGDFIMVGEVKNGEWEHFQGFILEVTKICFSNNWIYVDNDEIMFNIDNDENFDFEYIYPVSPALKILYGVENGS